MPPGGPPPLCAKRVGHGGTLDPDATGVLPVLIGEATKLMPYLVDQDKEYVATVRFGITTDTHDMSGRVLAGAPVPDLPPAGLAAACRPFVGRITQVPPMYSAVHHDGRRLYELARAGVAVERAPREVVVRSITLEEVAPPRAPLRVVCGKGTYLRVLAGAPARAAPLPVPPRPAGGRRPRGAGRRRARARPRRGGRDDRRGRAHGGRRQGQARADPACGRSGDSSPTRLTPARARWRSAPSTASTWATGRSSDARSSWRARGDSRRWGARSARTRCR